MIIIGETQIAIYLNARTNLSHHHVSFNIGITASKHVKAGMSGASGSAFRIYPNAVLR